MKTGIVLLPILVVSNCQDTNTYWGSYDLTIPGGSGAGNAVQNLALPNNAPEFFKFANFDRQQPAQPVQPVQQQVKQFIPQHGQQFKPAQQFRPAPAPQPAPQQIQQFRPAPQPAQQFRPAPQPAPQFRPAPQPAQQFRPAPQPTQQFRPAPQPAQQTPTAQLQTHFTIQTVVGSSQQQGVIPASTQGLRVFSPEPSTQKEPEPQPVQQFGSAPKSTQQFRPAPQPAPRPTQQFRPASVPAQPASRDYTHDSTGDNELSRYQLYLLRKKGQQPQAIQPKLQQPVSNEVGN